jgi:hypothetical protein
MWTGRVLLTGIILLVAGCAAAMSPEGRLRNEIFLDVYWTSVRGCEETARNLHVEDLGPDGDVTMSGDAGNSYGLSEFIQCYHQGIRQRVEHRRRAGLPVPEKLNLDPEVRFKPDMS